MANAGGWKKWFVVLLLFLATLLNYLDRQTIAVSASVISREFGLGDAQLGQLFFAFLFAYGIAQLFVGALLDRFPVRWAYAAAVIAWSLAGASAALATGFVSLFLLRVLLGVCECPNWPLALRVVARTIPPEQRSPSRRLLEPCARAAATLHAARAWAPRARRLRCHVAPARRAGSRPSPPRARWRALPRRRLRRAGRRRGALRRGRGGRRRGGGARRWRRRSLRRHARTRPLRCARRASSSPRPARGAR